MKEIPFSSLNSIYATHAKELEDAALRVLRSGWYILGNEVQQFEKKFAAFNHANYCIGVNSGLDALTLAIRGLGLGEGDEIIVPAHTYIATVLAVTENKATPIFVEPDEYFNINVEKVEQVITSKTKAILPVHLYGQPCNMDAIMALAKAYNLYVVEDCAQSHGACYKGKMTGSFGDFGCYSFYPTKNLGAFGDAGAVITNSSELYHRMNMLRNYGSRSKYHHEIEGVNSRLDELQAALLSVKLQHLDSLTKERQQIAALYLEGIRNDYIELPKTAPYANHVYHLFVIRLKERDKLQTYLQAKGISTQIHYPIPPHLAQCYSHLGYGAGDFPVAERYAQECLSLPLYNGMNINDVEYVIQMINSFRV
jgi:dTDP-4-amino-4,6-dideoxygalactose transaminase